MVQPLTLWLRFGGEELGWRGFLLKQCSYMDFWKMSLVIGIIWGLWHAPIIIQGYNYPQNPVIGVFMMIGFVYFSLLYFPMSASVPIRLLPQLLCMGA